MSHPSSAIAESTADGIVDRVRADLIRAVADADRAADVLASELRVRLMAGQLQLEHDDPVMLALVAWHEADCRRAVLEGAVGRRS